MVRLLLPGLMVPEVILTLTITIGLLPALRSPETVLFLISIPLFPATIPLDMTAPCEMVTLQQATFTNPTTEPPDSVTAPLLEVRVEENTVLMAVTPLVMLTLPPMVKFSNLPVPEPVTLPVTLVPLRVMFEPVIEAATEPPSKSTVVLVILLEKVVSVPVKPFPKLTVPLTLLSLNAPFPLPLTAPIRAVRSMATIPPA